MALNTHKENMLFDRNKNIDYIQVSNIKPHLVIEDIEKIKNNKENIYIFKSGDKAEFLYERSCVNDLSFNYFQIYNKTVYKALKEICFMLQNICNDTNVDVKKNIYYITSEYEEDFFEDYWYDSGGVGVPSFCGYWFLETKDDAYIKVNKKINNVSSGDIVIFPSGTRTEFQGIYKGISFNISTLSKLVGQYPQKWMPIVLS